MIAIRGDRRTRSAADTARSTSRFGIEYDSLSDLVAFGVAPGILVYKWALEPWGNWGWLAASLYGADWKAKAQEDPSLAVKMPVKKTANYDKLKEYADDFPTFLNVSANADFPPAVFGPDKKPIDRESGMKASTSALTGSMNTVHNDLRPTIGM